MKDILVALSLALSQYRSKADAALGALGPLDQLQVGREVLYGLSCLEESRSYMVQMIEQADQIMAKLPGEMESAVAATLSAKITAGEIFSKEVFDGAIIAAKSSAKDEAKVEFETQVAAEKARVELIAARRQELAKDHPAEAVAALSDDIVAAEQFDNVIKAEFGRRVVALSELGITAKDKAETFGKIACGPAFDEAGITAFDTNLDLMKTAVGFVAKPPGTIAAALKPGGVPIVTPPGSGDPEKKKVFAI